MSIRVPKSFLILLCVILIMVGIALSGYAPKSETYPEVITSEEQFGEMVYRCASTYHNRIKFKCTLNLESYDFDILFREIMDRDTYVGSELFRYSYTYRIAGDGMYDVSLSIENPTKNRVRLTKKRAKQIAGKLRGLDRYDQIKAVHDYLVVHNEYSYSHNGAYDALYKNRSACNGYAFSFYAIMQELGIPATVEYGGSHAWNLVELDGEWYNVDCTWDDPNGRNISYAYFLKSNTEFPDHDHYSATAAQSFDMSKAGKSDYYKRIPPYRLIGVLKIFALVAFLIVSYVVLRKRKIRKDMLELEAFKVYENKYYDDIPLMSEDDELNKQNGGVGLC